MYFSDDCPALADLNSAPGKSRAMRAPAVSKAVH